MEVNHIETMDNLKQKYNSQIKQTLKENKNETNNLKLLYEEKVVQLQQAKEQIQWANEEVAYYNQIVQILNNQMNFLQQELREAQNKQEINDRHMAQENEKELNKLLQKPQVPSALQRKGLSFVDHKLMTQHNGYTIFSRFRT